MIAIAYKRYLGLPRRINSNRCHHGGQAPVPPPANPSKPAQTATSKASGATSTLAAAAQTAPNPAPAAPTPPPAPAVQVLDPKCKDMTCFNCSWPGHYVGNCIEPKKCFICTGNHNVNNCVAWARPHPTATYFGSAATGLGFYHVDIPVASESSWLNYKNCAV